VIEKYAFLQNNFRKKKRKIGIQISLFFR